MVIPSLPVVEAPLVVTQTIIARDVWPLEDVTVLTQGLHVPRDVAAEARATGAVVSDLDEFHIDANPVQRARLVNFVANGDSWHTLKLGQGERNAVVRDALETMRTSNISAEDLDRLARGQIPAYRNLANEQAQMPLVRKTFRAIYHHDPVFSKPQENLGWNALMYRLRFPRDLVSEQQGILSYKKQFKGAPTTPFQWAVVRVLGYVH